jgi:hypothetical protein
LRVRGSHELSFRSFTETHFRNRTVANPIGEFRLIYDDVAGGFDWSNRSPRKGSGWTKPLAEQETGVNVRGWFGPEWSSGMLIVSMSNFIHSWPKEAHHDPATSTPDP